MRPKKFEYTVRSTMDIDTPRSRGTPQLGHRVDSHRKDRPPSHDSPPCSPVPW